MDIYSPTLHQKFYKKLFHCFSNCIPINLISNILNENILDPITDEIADGKNFEKSELEIETYGSIEEQK